MNKLFCKQFKQRELPGSRARTLIGYIPESTMSQDISKAEFSKKNVKMTDTECCRQFLRLLTTPENHFYVTAAIPC